MLIDDYSEVQPEVPANSFDDELSFSHWVFNPDLKEPYKDYLGKDIVLGNIKKESHFTRITNNLKLAVYLSKFTKPLITGFYFYVVGEEEPIRIDNKNQKEALNILGTMRPGAVVNRVSIIRSEEQVYRKSVHNFLTRAYTLSQTARAIDGMSLKHINTKYDINSRSLKDETERKGVFGGSKKSHWGEYEKQKNW